MFLAKALLIILRAKALMADSNTSSSSTHSNESADSLLKMQYDSKVSEEKWQNFWEEVGAYVFDEGDMEKEVYSIDTPPPTVSGKMHLGHACSFSQQDFIAR